MPGFQDAESRKYCRDLKRALAAAGWLAVMAFALMAITPADAMPVSGPITLTYDVNLQPGISGVTNIMVIEKYANVGGYSYTFQPLLQLSPGSSSFSLNLSPTASQGSLVSTLALGRIPGDPSSLDTDHLVVFANFAQDQLGLSYEDVFPDAIEEKEIIIDLRSIYVPGTQFPDLAMSLNQDEISLAAEVDSLGMFTAPGTDVDAVSFSTGTLVGTGTVTAVPTAVPEPLTLSLFGAGLAGAFAARRKTKKT
jgi:hypothetical protein